MITTLMLTAQMLLTTVTVDVHTVPGEVFTGQLAGLTADSVTLQAGEASVIPIEQVLRIVNVDAGPADRQPMRIELQLTDASRLLGSGLTSSDGTASLQQPTGAVKIRTEAIHSVRFASPAVDDAWREIVSAPHEADTLVIRKRDAALDYLEGLVGSVGAEKVEFQFEGESLAVPLSKLEGWIYVHPTPAEPELPTATLVTRNGNTWRVRQIERDGPRLRVTSLAGVSVTLDEKELAHLDFALGKVVYLSDLQAERLHISPTIGAGSSEPLLAPFLYAPRADRSFRGDPLTLKFPGDPATVRYQKGLALHSRTETTYRLPDRFRKLRGVAGMDPQLRDGHTARLTISADGEVLLDVSIVAAAEPIPLDLNIENAKRITVFVDYGDELDVADRVHLCDLRVIK